MTLNSAQARSLSLYFDDFYLPRGATFHVYTEDYENILGAFTSRNNRLNRSFATAPISGEAITLEYFEPTAVYGEGVMSLVQVSRGFYTIDQATNEAARTLACQVNAVCSPEGNGLEEHTRSITKIVIASKSPS